MNTETDQSTLSNKKVIKKDKRAKFLELGEKRVARAIHALRSLGNLADRNNYSYTERDALEISKALRIELNDVINKFKTPDSDSSHTVFRFSDNA